VSQRLGEVFGDVLEHGFDHILDEGVVLEVFVVEGEGDEVGLSGFLEHLRKFGNGTHVSQKSFDVFGVVFRDFEL